MNKGPASTAKPSATKPSATTRIVRFVVVLAVLACVTACLARPLQMAAASAIAMAPNHGMTANAPRAGETMVAVGPPMAVISLRIVEPATARPGTIFLLHGIRDTSASLEGWALLLANHGYRSVLVDLRGHGRSTGDYLSYGVVESRDLTQVVDELLDKKRIDGPIGAMGLSYGGAVAIQWAGSDPRVRAVVAVAPFASLRTVVVPGYVPSFVPTSFVQGAIDEAGRIAGFDPDAASSVLAITKTRAAVLVIHSRADTKIPFEHAQRIVEAAPSHAQVILIDGVGHGNMGGDRDGTIAARAPVWFETHL